MFSFGKTSLAEIARLHPDLKAVITEALKISAVDYGILHLGGARTAQEQNQLYLQGRSLPGKVVTSLDGYKKPSNHQIKEDGFGHAVDLVPYKGGFTWDWELIYPIAQAVAVAAKAAGVSIRWGGVWDRRLEELKIDDLEGEVRAYCDRHPGVDHIDGPHYEYMGKLATKAVKK